MKLSNIIASLFYLGMAFYFMYAFFFPEQTNYWLINNGFLIMFLELLSLMTFNFNLYLSGKQSGIISEKFKILLMMFILAAIPVIIYEKYILMLYFIISVTSKYFANRDVKQQIFERKTTTLGIFIILVSFFLSLIIATLFKKFPQIELQKSYMQQHNNNVKGFTLEGVAPIAVWGMLYFFILGIIYLVGWQNAYNYFFVKERKSRIPIKK